MYLGLLILDMSMIVEYCYDYIKERYGGKDKID